MDLVKSPTSLRRWTVASLVANLVLVFTGGLVRVTASGLGCDTWPQCEAGSYVPHSEAGAHQFIEFGNRTLTFVLIAIAIATFVAAWKARDAAGKPRRDLRILAFVAGIGIPAQAVIGGLSVLSRLNPWVVSLHLLDSLAIIVVCVALVSRAYDREPLAVTPVVGWLVRLVFTLGVLVVVLGTVVTGAGPNSGDGGAERNGLALETVAKVHAGSVWVTLAGLVLLLVLTRGGRAPAVYRASHIVFGISLLQGAIGYAQYFLGNPPALVACHMVGVALFTAAVANLLFCCRLAPAPAG
ncbi:MAG: COX15/CtaA family protein [Propionicimonas sp.]|uniref:COX15/CtaA family protein n=1 Tax=Propionicimonas sp. TaxID=1955623 RepID=UPI002B218484|nr:COX15/CtaA family protein [Propionicimonas sp.]MEA4942963.1 COX15/CtaA family protein [Propionicimonas sp.]MEA5055490.1 COX15/CtaA family protein [Propionicimonas sp.]MEA5118108.1 COX15/CtaA family protein [Propionicimonas sp.]